MSLPKQRFIFVDILRSLAIALALAAHAVNDFDIASRLATHEYVGIRLLTRAANPSFIFVFGMMLEIVYARKLVENGLGIVMPRLLWRSVQCYFGYAITVFAGWAMGFFGTAHFAQALVFIYGGHHGNILKFYTVALVFVIPLLWFRHRFGILATVTACLGVWLLGPLLDVLTSIPIGRFGEIRNLFLLSLPHNLTFIAAGMFVGHALRSPTLDRVNRTFYRNVGWVLGACLLIGGVLVWQNSVSTVLYSYLDYYQYRNSHHIGYYALGLLQAVSLCFILFLLFPLRSQALAPNSRLLSFGRSSLLSFTLGNVLLNILLGLGATNVPAYAGLGWTALFLVAMLLLVNGFEWTLARIRKEPSLSRVLRPVEFLQESGINPLSRYLHARGNAVKLRTASHLHRLRQRLLKA